jgi:hypothetical protein
MTGVAATGNSDLRTYAHRTVPSRCDAYTVAIAQQLPALVRLRVETSRWSPLRIGDCWSGIGVNRPYPPRHHQLVYGQRCLCCAGRQVLVRIGLPRIATLRKQRRTGTNVTAFDERLDRAPDASWRVRDVHSARGRTHGSARPVARSPRPRGNEASKAAMLMASSPAFQLSPTA